jgi:23S rRNA pseudouridine1911/1915/1917 synthase
MRLDHRLRELRPTLSWSKIRHAIEHGQVLVDGALERDPSASVGPSSAIDFDPGRRALPHARLELPRLYEDDEILIVDKPAGLLTVPTGGHARDSEDTVLRRVQAYARHLHGRWGYAGVLHRLDRDTSGALAVALSRDAHRLGRELFTHHEFNRWYLALVHGVPRHRRGTIDAHISNQYVSGRRRLVQNEREGRYAVTHYQIREVYDDAALLELRLETGRQHQIRLHLHSMGHPLFGERVYTDTDSPLEARRQMLHAWRLEFPHPLRRGVISAEAPMPRDMAALCRRLTRSAKNEERRTKN